MKEIFIKNKIVIFRTVGFLMLVVSFALYFWVTPKEVLTQNEIAARNVERMEASVSGSGKNSKKTSKPNSSKFLQELKNTQKKQIQYFTILCMVLGVGFFGYSFINKSKKSDSER